MESFVVLCTPLDSFGLLWNLIASPFPNHFDMMSWIQWNPKASHSMIGSILSYGTLCSPTWSFGVLWISWNLIASPTPYHLTWSYDSYGFLWDPMELCSMYIIFYHHWIKWDLMSSYGMLCILCYPLLSYRMLESFRILLKTMDFYEISWRPYTTPSCTIL